MCSKSSVRPAFLPATRSQGMERGSGSPSRDREARLSAVGRTMKGAFTPAIPPGLPLLPKDPQPLRAMQGATCEVVGDPAVPTVAAGLEAAVPRGQDVQVLLAQQGKAPAWKRRSCETRTEPRVMGKVDTVSLQPSREVLLVLGPPSRAAPPCSSMGLARAWPGNELEGAPPAWRKSMSLL